MTQLGDELDALTDRDCSEEAELATERRQRSDEVAEDAALVRRCAAGEVAAWEEFYSRFHPPLLAAVKAILPAERRDANLIDEIAARVWYALVENDGALLDRFDPNRGVRVVFFLVAVAKDQIRRHFRSESRRRSREASVGANELRRFAPDQSTDLKEFLSLLTPGERRFAGQHLLGEDAADAGVSPRQYSRASAWQFTRRIRLKLLRYLGRR